MFFWFSYRPKIFLETLIIQVGLGVAQKAYQHYKTPFWNECFWNQCVLADTRLWKRAQKRDLDMATWWHVLLQQVCSLESKLHTGLNRKECWLTYIYPISVVDQRNTWQDIYCSFILLNSVLQMSTLSYFVQKSLLNDRLRGLFSFGSSSVARKMEAKKLLFSMEEPWPRKSQKEVETPFSFTKKHNTFLFMWKWDERRRSCYYRCGKGWSSWENKLQDGQGKSESLVSYATKSWRACFWWF